MVDHKPGGEPAAGPLPAPPERGAGMPELDAYRKGRLQAQSMRIQASMDRRRFGGAPEICDTIYEVLER